MIAAAGLAVVVLVTGCSADGTPAAGSATGLRDTTVPVSESDPNAGLKSGTELRRALLTDKDLPARYKATTNLQRDSAETFSPPTKVIAPTAASCKELESNLWIEAAGSDSAAFAQTGFTDSYGSEVDAEIESYRGSDARAVMTNLAKLFKICSTFKTTVEGAGRATVKVTVKAGPNVGDSSIGATVTSPVWEGGTTLIAVRVGSEVVSVLSASAKNNGGATATKMAKLMVARLGQS
ncbi:MAG TPA: hypothetical protein VLL08_10070 [Kineosporiaceae bacterium]|nr:hypothetical protein [Kineosporiaceae bacterium]